MPIKKVVQKWWARPYVRQVSIAVAAILIFGLGTAVGDGRLRLPGKSQTGLPTALNYATVNKVYEQLRENYSGKLSESQVLDGLKHGLAESTGDPYTQYFTASEAKTFNGDLQGQSLSGIGAQLDQDQQGNIVVMSPLDGSPAAAAGVQAKDIIVTINGQSTAGMSLATAVGKIRGPKGSKVTLGIQRGDQSLTLTITRDTISVPTATTKILDDNVGYIQVSQFSDDTYALIQQGITKFQQAGVKKIILDLRDNPGGEVTSAQDISSLWLKEGTMIMYQKGTDNSSYRATGNDPLQGMATVVLVNPGSASAAEITALALRDNKAATIIGEKSYGKGVVQQVIPFTDDSELKVTVAKWYSPKGTNINHKGITPDQTVKEPADATVDNDPQLQAAQAYLANH